MTRGTPSAPGATGADTLDPGAAGADTLDPGATGADTLDPGQEERARAN